MRALSADVVAHGTDFVVALNMTEPARFLPRTPAFDTVSCCEDADGRIEGVLFDLDRIAEKAATSLHGFLATTIARTLKFNKN